MARKKSPLNERRDRIRTWFDTCDPNQTQVRDALKRAAKILWCRQTLAEQDATTTTDHNGVGYNRMDADFASRIINWHGTLTERMAWAARKMLRKYAKQLAEMALLKETQQ